MADIVSRFTCANTMTNIPLPKSWPQATRFYMQQVVALAQYAFAYTRSVAANSPLERVRLKAENEQLKQEVAWLKEELRIKDARLAAIPSHKRPHYSPLERMAILVLRAARNWTLAQTAERFLVTAETIASWTKRVATEGSESFINLPVPVNKFPEYVGEVVRQLEVTCPFLGKVKIADNLARGGIHLGVSTVGRMLKKSDSQKPSPQDTKPVAEPSTDSRPPKKITSNRSNHVWLVDLTTVPILLGMWTAWFPFSLPPVWPFVYWLAVVEDHHSRRVLNVKAFRKLPTSLQVRRLLDTTMLSCGKQPKHLICDKGRQFWNDKFKAWAKRKQVRLRFGAVGKHGSIALIERLNWTVKHEWLLEVRVSPRLQDFQAYLKKCRSWHNAYRPHMALRGRTPNEVYFRRKPANERPRIEPRDRWPRRLACALPVAKVEGKTGQRFSLQVRRYQGETNLPIVTLRRVA